MSCFGEPAGLHQVEEAHDVYKAMEEKPKASGVILHRKDQLVNKFKWVPCTWKITGHTLTLTPTLDDIKEDTTWHLTSDTEYKKPKSKRYMVQFGTSTKVHTSAVLQVVARNVTTGVMDPLARDGPTKVEALGKVGSLDQKELEKLLYCIQAIKEGKNASAYLDLDKQQQLAR